MSIDAMQQALKALESINEMSKPPMNIPLAAEIDGAMDALRQAIREAALDGLAQTSQEIENPLDIYERAYFAGKRDGVAEVEQEIDRLTNLNERLVAAAKELGAADDVAEWDEAWSKMAKLFKESV
jgi:hypothetical protein